MHGRDLVRAPDGLSALAAAPLRALYGAALNALRVPAAGAWRGTKTEVRGDRTPLQRNRCALPRA